MYHSVCDLILFEWLIKSWKPVSSVLYNTPAKTEVVYNPHQPWSSYLAYASMDVIMRCQLWSVRSSILRCSMDRIMRSPDFFKFFSRQL